jgi:hypothetical protein
LAVLTKDASAIVGMIIPQRPSASNLSVEFDPESGMLKAKYDLSRHAENRAEVRWIKLEPK